MLTLTGKWALIPPSETDWMCEYGPDEPDLYCKACNQSPDKGRNGAMNRAHWAKQVLRPGYDQLNYLCSYHYELLLNQPIGQSSTPAPAWPSAAEFASTFDNQ